MINCDQLKLEPRSLLMSDVGNECRRRAAVSRAYLFAFHKIAIEARRLGHRHSKLNHVHPEQQAINFAKRSSNVNVRRAASLCDVLYIFRKRSDFYLGGTIAIADVQDALDHMEQVDKYLSVAP